VGLLSKDNVEQISFAYKVYKSRDDKSEVLASRFKKAFGREVKIDFLGVWFVSVPMTGMFRPSLIVVLHVTGIPSRAWDIFIARRFPL
jgi:uncharacterized protein (DUF2235 family)